MSSKNILISAISAISLIAAPSSLLSAQQPLTAVQKKATGDYITQIRTGFNTELAKQHAMNTELYTSLSSAAAFLSAWGWSPGLGTVDLTAPGPIGSTTPNTGKFTTLQADSLDIVPPSGETGEMAVHEDPASSGDDWVGFKAPVNVAPGGSDGDLLWVLPSTDGTEGQVMSTDGASNLSWATPLYPSNIGTTVQAYNTNLVDLADGSLTGTKVDLSALTGTIYSTGALYGRVPVIAKAVTPVTLTAAECSSAIVTNTGATAAIVFTLPDATAGMRVTVSLTAAYDIDINPYGAERILVLTDADGDAISSDGVVGSYITLVAVSSTEWMMVGGAGVWTDVN